MIAFVIRIGKSKDKSYEKAFSIKIITQPQSMVYF